MHRQDNQNNISLKLQLLECEH